jgi:hypothetical protein
MQNKIFKNSIELNINKKTIKFTSVADFVFAMEGRISPSSEKLSELFKMPVEELKKEVAKIEAINKSLFSVLSRIVEEPDCIMEAIKELDSSIFSKDHGWRDILIALNNSNEESNPLRVTALNKYMQYLSSIEDAIRHIRKTRNEPINEHLVNDDRKLLDFGATWGPGQLPMESIADPKIKDDFRQLPKNKAVALTLPPGERLDIRLASYICKLIAMDSDFQFIDNDKVVTLNNGSYVIGRSAKSAIQVDSTKKDVSRSHLLIHISNGNKLQLTDLSTAGSFIPSKYQISLV